LRTPTHDDKVRHTVQRNDSDRVLSNVRSAMERHRMVAPGDRVLVAVSGGPDSVALLAVLVRVAARFQIEVRAAHFNHRLRGAEADRDQAAVEALAGRLGVPCAVGASGVAGGPGVEARARSARYGFLHRTAAAWGCRRIATGHTQDDQAETVLMRLLRGSGPDGLRAIHAVRRDGVIRPLIDCTRTQVLAFLEARSLPFCTDTSNTNRRFLRNQVRHDVLPLLRAINPRVDRALATAAGLQAAEGAWLDGWVRGQLASGAANEGTLPLELVEKTPAALRGRLVRVWLRAQNKEAVDWTARHVAAVLRLTLGPRPSASVQLPGGTVVCRRYDRLQWLRTGEGASLPRPSDVEQPLEVGASVRLPPAWVLSADRAVQPFEMPRDHWEALVDIGSDEAPLLVRPARRGDRIQPLGMAGHRKLQDVFTDRKVPATERALWPAVECRGEIIWVPGLIRGAGAAVTTATRTVVRLRAARAGIAGPGGLC
jgi:tRNA(Ile)-lysidine synthase